MWFYPLAAIGGLMESSSPQHGLADLTHAVYKDTKLQWQVSTASWERGRFRYTVLYR